MHDTSYAKMQHLLEAYVQTSVPMRILDIGARIVKGDRSYRNLCQQASWTYQGADLDPGDNVDVVLDGPEEWPSIANDSYEVILSGQMLEHARRPWDTIREMARILKPGGIALLIAPSAGPEHRYPQDCWRFYPDGMRSLAECSGLDPIEVHTDWGLVPWQDTVAVLQKPLGADGNGRAGAVNLDVCFRWYHLAAPPVAKTEAYWLHLIKELRARRQHQEATKALEEACSIHKDSLALRPMLLVHQLKTKAWDDASFTVSWLLHQPKSTRPSLHAIESALEKMPDSHVNSLLEFLRLPGRIGTMHRKNAAAFELSRTVRLLDQARTDRWMMDLAHCVRLRADGDLAGARTAFRQHAQAKETAGFFDRTGLLNRLIARHFAKTYLEIGVSLGSNFFQIDCPERLAVDPAFQVPGGIGNEPGTSWFPMTSDAFFQECAGAALPNGADVIFIDGLHTYEQSLRDATHALRHLNPGGIIVMHDCLPATEAEEAPTQHLSRIMDPASNVWTGDVWKSIVHLRCLHEDLDIFTIDADHGLGVIRRGQRSSRPNLSLEQVSRLTYDDLIRRKGELLDLRDIENSLRCLNLPRSAS